MDMNTEEFLLRASLQSEELTILLEAGWLLPRRAGDSWAFSEIDVARALLTRDLRRDLGINEEGVGVILDLIDQLHGLRRTMGDLLSILDNQPEAVRRDIVAAIRGRQPFPKDRG